MMNVACLFADVIHSNGENLILGGLGSWQPMGHVGKWSEQSYIVKQRD